MPITIENPTKRDLTKEEKNNLIKGTVKRLVEEEKKKLKPVIEIVEKTKEVIKEVPVIEEKIVYKDKIVKQKSKVAFWVAIVLACLLSLSITFQVLANTYNIENFYAPDNMLDDTFGSVWNPTDPGSFDLGDIGNVDTSGLSNDDILVYDLASLEWLPEAQAQGSGLWLTSTNGTIYYVGGNVNIGTSSEGTASLYIQGTSTNDILNILDVGGTERFTILNGGNVGIGTVNPAYELDVNGDAQISGRLFNKIAYFFNGTFAETFDFRVVSDGSVATGTLTNACGTSTLDMTMQFNGADTVLETSDGSAQIVLTAGTDAGPTTNYIYIPQSTGVLTKSTTDWPTAEHIKVAFLYVPSTAYMQTQGPYINQNWNDHVKNCSSQGHLSELGSKVRQGLKGYFSGLGGNGDGGTYVIRTDATPDTVFVAVASGTMFQMHKQTFTSKDTSGVVNDFHVVNQDGDNFAEGTDLYDFLTDADGDSMSGKYYNIVLWAVANKTDEYSPLMVNLPTCSYNTQAGATGDSSSCDVFDIPREFQLDSNTGYLVARMTMRHQSGAQDLTLISTVDLRGVNPTSVTAGANTNHDPVTLSGAFDYLTLSAQDIALGQIDLATDVTGILPITSGGTGSSSDRFSSTTVKDIIDSTTASTTPDDTDKFVYSGGSILNHLTWANIITALTEVFDRLFQPLNAILTSVAAGSYVGDDDIVTVGTLTAGATGASFTVDLDSSTLTCTDCIDFSANTNATGGRSVTLNGDAIDADAEIYTEFFTWNDKAVAVATNTTPEGVKYFGQAATVTIGECACDTASTTLQFDERTTPYIAGTDILTSALVCDEVASTTSFANASIGAGHYVGIEVLTLTGSPNQCEYTLKYTYDD